MTVVDAGIPQEMAFEVSLTAKALESSHIVEAARGTPKIIISTEDELGETTEFSLGKSLEIRECEGLSRLDSLRRLRP